MCIKKVLWVVLVASMGCGNKGEILHKESTEEKRTGSVEITREQFESVGMEIGTIERRNLKDVVRANGYLKVPPQNQASVSAVMGGIVRSIAVKDGDFVRQGQVLATLEHPDYIKLQEELVTTKSSFSFIEKEYERQKELQKDNAGTLKTLQQIESNYVSEKARLASLEKQLELLGLSMDEVFSGRVLKAVGLRSPIDGYISRIDAKIGTMAEEAKPLFDIIDNSKVHVDLFVYEKDLARLVVGQKVNLKLPNQDNRIIEGRVFSINKSFENESKSVIVHAEIPGSKTMNLFQGMYVTALINVGESQVACVPQEAVVHSDGRDYIFIVTEEKDGSVGSNLEKEMDDKGDSKDPQNDQLHFQMVEVKIGVSDLGFIEIDALQRLPDTAKVAIKETFFLLSKTKEGETE